MGEVIKMPALFFRQPRLVRQTRRMFHFAFQGVRDPNLKKLRDALIAFVETNEILLLPIGGVSIEVDRVLCRSIDSDLDSMPVEDAQACLKTAYVRMVRELGLSLHTTLAYRLSFPGCSNAERHRVVMPHFERLAYIWSRLV